MQQNVKDKSGNSTKPKISIDWGQVITGIIAGAILGVAGMFYVQGQQIAKLETELALLKNQVIELNKYSTSISKEKIVEPSTHAKGYKIEVKLTEMKLEYNNNIGNNWTTHASVNEKTVTSDEAVYINSDEIDSIILEATASENDNFPDSGSAKEVIGLSELVKNEVHTYPLKVIVKENGGRYKGNTAEWKFIFSIRIIE